MNFYNCSLGAWIFPLCYTRPGTKWIGLGWLKPDCVVCKLYRLPNLLIMRFLAYIPDGMGWLETK